MSTPCSGCSASLNCPGDESFPYTLTPLAPYPWVINCPINVDCSLALSVTMDCCDTPTTVNIPAGTSANDRIVLLNQLITQCLFLEDGCDTDSGSPNDPPPTPPTAFYFNSAQTATWTCAEQFGGGTYYYTIRAGMFLSQSLTDANALAFAAATAFVRANHFCANPPCLCPCADIATVINIPLTGGHGPFTVAIDSGTLPTGMTLSISGGVVKLTGTPTVTGLTTVTIKVTDPAGGYLLKTLAVYVLKISTTSPLPALVIGTPYSKQLVGVGGTGTYTFSIITGALPTGLTMSAAGLISGTPTSGATTFTVRMRDAGLSQTTGGCEKEFTFESPDGIYYELGTTAGAIAVDSFGENDTDLNQGARTLVSGPIVSAWLFNSVVPPVEPWFDSSTLSDKTIIPSKSITIRFWVKCLEPVTLLQAFQEFVIATRYFSIEIKDGALNGAYNKSPDSGTGYGFICYGNTDAVDDGNWHRIIFTYDEDTGEARFQVDNNTPTLETVNESLIVENGSHVFTAPAVPDVVAVQLCPYFQIIGSGYPPPYNASGYYAGVYLAEVYVSLGVVWDDADCTYDWNSGAGRTYPDLP